jgi:hypothetical protein
MAPKTLRASLPFISKGGHTPHINLEKTDQGFGTRRQST